MRLKGVFLVLFFSLPLAAQPDFNRSPGRHMEGFWLKLQSRPGISFRYTLDGSVPHSGSLLWPDSLWVDNPSLSPNSFSEVRTTLSQEELHYKAWESPAALLDKMHILRLAEFVNGKVNGPVYTRHDIILPEAPFPFHLPLVSLVSDSMNLFSYDSGIYVPGERWDAGDPEWSGNYFMKGREWERNVHVAYFSPEGILGFSQDAGLRIHGGMTRQASQKTLRLYARTDYGEKYFKEALFAGRDAVKHKRFLLRTTMGSWGDQSIFKDVLVHELARGMHVEIMDYQPVIVYLNGEYWGIHTMRERVDNWYLNGLYELDKDSVDLINGNWGLVEEGTNEHYIALAEYLAVNDPGSTVVYEEVERQIDISSFIDYLIVKMYFSDRDWPGNNQKLWRPQGEDGRWRWILTDMDAGFPERPGPMFEHALGEVEAWDWRHQPVSSFLMRNLLNNEDFVNRFISRWLQVLDDEFDPGRAGVLIDSLKTLYENELPSHIERWSYPDGTGDWERDLLTHLYGFMVKRREVVMSELREYFGDHELLPPEEPAAELELELRPGPQPSDGSFTLYNFSDQLCMGELAVYDLNGRLLYRQDYIHVPPGGFTSLHIPGLGSGVHLLKLDYNGRSQVLPLVLIR